MDAETYNAIAAQAQTDAALAQRIASLQTQGNHTAHGNDGAPATEPTTPPASN